MNLFRIVFFNNWRGNQEFILVEISDRMKERNFRVFTFAIVGFGFSIVLNKLINKDK